MHETQVNIFSPYNLTKKDIDAVCLTGVAGLILTACIVVDHNNGIDAVRGHVDQQEARMATTASYMSYPPQSVSAADLKGYQVVMQKTYDNQQQILFKMVATEPDPPDLYASLVDCGVGFFGATIAAIGILKLRRWAIYHKQVREKRQREEEIRADRDQQRYTDWKFKVVTSAWGQTPTSFPDEEKI